MCDELLFVLKKTLRIENKHEKKVNNIVFLVINEKK